MDEFSKFANLGGLGILAYVLWSASRYLAEELRQLLARQEQTHQRTQEILLRTINANTEALTQMREMLRVLVSEGRDFRNVYGDAQKFKTPSFDGSTCQEKQP
jgi:hypothetical protein